MAELADEELEDLEGLTGKRLQEGPSSAEVAEALHSRRGPR